MPIPNKFLWGAATSGHQVDGNNIHSDWWHWEAQGHIEGGVSSGTATDHWNRYKEDLKLAADLGLTSYRFSIEWARLEPKENQWDESVFDWYEAMISECEKLNLLPMLTLHHFTLPQWLAEKGGFAWSGAPEKFAELTRRVVKRIGSRVPLWCTLNEPMVLVAGGYLGSFMPPAKFDPKTGSLVCHRLLQSHVKAFQIIHNEMPERSGPWRTHPLLVGIAHNMMDFQADRFWHPIERILTHVFWRFYNRAWLDAVTGRKQHFGVLGLMPFADQVQEARHKLTVDFIGINYYTKAYAQWRPRDAAPGRSSELPIGIEFARRKEPASDVQWALHPKGLSRMIRFVKQYRLPIYITENGIADYEDKLRPEYICEHLQEVAKAIERGADVRGYYYWSLLDNFEWIKGFGPRFGLYRVNFSNFERAITRSAELLKKIISACRSRAPNTAVLASMLLRDSESKRDR